MTGPRRWYAAWIVAPCVEPINVGVAKGVSISDLAERIRAIVELRRAHCIR